MPLSVQIGLLLSVATALASIVGFLYKHRGAVDRPDVDWRRPVWSSLDAVRLALVHDRRRWSRWPGWGFHVGALALAPISLVQATIAGGLVMLTVVADRFFAHEVTRREWIGVALAAAGLAFLAATLDGGADEAHSDYETQTLADLGCGGDRGRARRRHRSAAARRRAGVLFGASAGLLWAASDTTIKALSDELGESSFAAIMLSPGGPD